EYEIDNDRFLRVTRADASFIAEVLPIPKTRSLEVVGGQIDRNAPSLFAAMDEAGEAIDLSIGLAGIFSGEIDFNTEVQPGDRFELLVEKQYR
ncbi:MAG: peptidase M23, partial [Acidobacteria bacterium]